MPLSPGERLSHYEILSLIGEGGMGIVYRATDTRVHRDVAIKVSGERFSERFEREAQAIASLNHPNICTLHDVGPNFLVMEMLEGPTLAERLKEGAIPLAESLEIAGQIADALEAAHEKGVVHRDLKPGNIKIKPDGTVKVLDFGLAKMGGTPSLQSDESPTVTMGQTEAGVILGTAGYMSPEQAKGKRLDPRTDIYSFGAVVYEMVTGKRLHSGETTTEVLASVIKEEPRWERVPAQVQRLLRRCLEKDPLKRLRHIGDVMALVDDVPVVPARGGLAVQPARWLWPSVAVAALIALGVALFFLLPKPVPPAAVSRFEIAQPDTLTFINNFAVSPDGRKLAFMAATGSMAQLWIRSFDAVQARPLAGTEPVRGIPFWSPDSRYIVFWADGKLQKIDAAGGPAQTLCPTDQAVNGGFWTRDDKIVFGVNAGSGLWQVSAAGGTPSPLTTLTGSEARHVFPVLLPDGRHFLYVRAAGPVNGGIYLGSLDAKPREQEVKPLLPDASRIAYAPPIGGADNMGHLLFVRGGTLMAQPFDSQRLALTGEAVPLAEQLGANAFSASDTGVLVYRTGGFIGQQQLLWYDRQGRNLGTIAEPFEYPGVASSPAVSPDGKRIAYARGEGQSGNADIWLYEIARGISTRFTTAPGRNTNPVWSPDGSRIAFAGLRGGVMALYQKASNLVGGEELLYKAGDAPVGPPINWSHDGRFILYGAGGIGVWMLPVEGPAPHKPVLLVSRDFNQRAARFSPDGRFFTYISNKAGRDDVYVRSFDPAAPSGSGAEWTVSKNGGDGAHWRKDGKEIYYMAPDRTVMAVEVTTTPSFQPGTPKPLFKSNAALPYWEVTPDGQKFLVPVAVGANAAAPYTVVLNWQAALKK